MLVRIPSVTISKRTECQSIAEKLKKGLIRYARYSMLCVALYWQFCGMLGSDTRSMGRVLDVVCQDLGVTQSIQCPAQLVEGVVWDTEHNRQIKGGPHPQLWALVSNFLQKERKKKEYPKNRRSIRPHHILRKSALIKPHPRKFAQTSSNKRE